MGKKRVLYVLIWVLSLGAGTAVYAQENTYLCEIGVQAGCGYYVGDAAAHIFMHPREAYGLHFRYKFTKRWAVQAKVSGQRLTGYDYTIRGQRLDTKWQTQVIAADIMGEFNFFRYGTGSKYDKRLRPYTPYIFLGLGVGAYNGEWLQSGQREGASGVNEDALTGTHVAVYLPLGIGFKWKFSEHCGLNIAWQHNIYMADNLECRKALDNKHQLNGWNWMNCDLTGMITIGMVFEFAQAPKACKICNW